MFGLVLDFDGSCSTTVRPTQSASKQAYGSDSPQEDSAAPVPVQLAPYESGQEGATDLSHHGVMESFVLLWREGEKDIPGRDVRVGGRERCCSPVLPDELFLEGLVLSAWGEDEGGKRSNNLVLASSSSISSTVSGSRGFQASS